MRKDNGQFGTGRPSNFLPVGSVRIRTRWGRGKEQRAFVKVGLPNVWKLRAVVVWEGANGPVPKGMGLHHQNENTLDDKLSNLNLVSKAKHLAIHRPEFQARAIKKFVAARKRLRWSTISKTKRTGRHPNNCGCPLHKP